MTFRFPILKSDVERVAREFGCSLEEAAAELRLYAQQEAQDWERYRMGPECIACGRAIPVGRKCLECLT